jgi:hypothetical protein
VVSHRHTDLPLSGLGLLHRPVWRPIFEHRRLVIVTPAFMIALRGFDIEQIDQLLQQADEALATEDQAVRAAACQALRHVQLKRRLRGYARAQVEQSIQERLEALDRKQAP